MRIFEGRREGVVGGRIWADWFGALWREEFEGNGDGFSGWRVFTVE